MRKELDYFKIENRPGGSQEWFRDPLMRIGGCAAIAACESCIDLDLHHGTDLYPYEKTKLCREDYVDFGMRMKPYLHPRLMGINRLEMYIRGFGKYLTDRGSFGLRMVPFHGARETEAAKRAVKAQIDRNLPIPFLLLKHQNLTFRNYVWHWFLLTGYEGTKEEFRVKAVTYGNFRWLSLDALWDTGYPKKGGMILYELSEESEKFSWKTGDSMIK